MDEFVTYSGLTFGFWLMQNHEKKFRMNRLQTARYTCSRLCAGKRLLPIITAITLSIVLTTGCRLDTASQQPRLAENQQQVPDQESWNSSLTTTSSGRITTRISFGHMSRFNEKRMYEFDQKLHVDFYDKDGKITSWLKSEKGTLNEITNMMEATGNVVAHSDSSNLTLYTEQLFRDGSRRKLTSNKEVMITTNQDTLFGLGFESEFDLDKWVIKKPWGHSLRPVELGLKKELDEKPKASQQQNE